MAFVMMRIEKHSKKEQESVPYVQCSESGTCKGPEVCPKNFGWS